MEHQREFVEHFPYGKQIGKILAIQNKQKRHRAPKHILFGLKSETSGIRFNIWIFCEKYLKFAHAISVHNGSYTFPNELMGFRIEATPIWVKLQKHCKNAVINEIWL